MGILFQSQDKLVEFEKVYQHPLRGYEKKLSLEHPSPLDTIHNLGTIHSSQGRLAEAVKLLKRARTGPDTALGLEHTSTLHTHILGLLYLNQGKLARSKE
jgi:hypothetical protein